ncbi:aminoglycoside phosphotransferase family protein [Hymenobacter tibetensis]|uniref:Aminoglycoside phosphotransferase family protein n=1 Tax=Hymenobacter tibetensis TaxID=497967 RepID=A0ABY4CX61_9BACT|nr:phosphotransferase [Hymenobacter tibetensis]UOG74860.1 aminoglycoside phosphotransferase family protein [Hymenobacter tibetensis]
MNKQPETDLLAPAFLEAMLAAHAPHQTVRVLSVVPFPLDNSASILVTLTAGQSTKTIGHFGLTVTLDVDGERQVHDMVLKVKPNGREISAMLASLAVACGGELAAVYPSVATRTGFQHTHKRELEVCQLPAADPIVRIWGTYADDEAEVYCVLMEYLQDVTLLNSVMAPHAWTDQHLRTALTQLATWHARYLTTGASVPSWLDIPSAAYMQEMSPLWAALLTNAATHFPDLYTTERTELLRAAIQQIPSYWAWQANRPKTLIHNDLNPRNTCFKMQHNALHLCAYDWELATYQVPSYDVVELLCFVLTEDRYHLRHEYLEHYRQVLHNLTGHYADAAAFRREVGYAALDFGLHRLGLYLMAHAVSPYPFLPRVVNSYFDTLAQLLEPSWAQPVAVVEFQ